MHLQNCNCVPKIVSPVTLGMQIRQINKLRLLKHVFYVSLVEYICVDPLRRRHLVLDVNFARSLYQIRYYYGQV